MYKKLLSALMLCLCTILTKAQELNCKVTVMHDKITGVDVETFNSLQKAINEFMNQHKWTTDEFQATEKIDCTIFINLTANKVNNDNDTYNATLSVQASRPVYNSGYISTLCNYMDRDITFKYTQFNTLQFDDSRIAGIDAVTSNLTAILAYYAYLIIALDYDSFSPEGGTAYLKKAQNIVNNAPEDKSIAGWKAVESTRNRYHLTDDLLNSRFGDVRSYWYTMHREGFDSMYTKPIDSRTRILTGIKKLYNVNRENPNSMLMQFFFSAKSDEFVHLLAAAPKTERAQYISLLSTMDVANAARYNNLKQ